MEKKSWFLINSVLIKTHFIEIKEQLVLIKWILKEVLSKKDLYAKKGSLKYFVDYISETNAFTMPLCMKLPQVWIF